MIQTLTYGGKKVVIIHNHPSTNILEELPVEELLQPIKCSNSVKTVLFLVECSCPAGILLHMKFFSDDILLKDAVTAVKYELESPTTTFSGLEIILERTNGIHPRVYFKKLLQDNDM